MRMITWKSGAAMVALGAAFLFAAPLKAQNAADKPSAGTQGDQARVEAARDFRSSQIIGLAVRNKANENIGKIDDLVIDMKTGDVRYAALSFGGFVGIGSKLFAVPLEAMTFKSGDPNKVNDRYFVFDVTKEHLDKAPGFDSSHWPDVANKEWSASIDKHYNVNRPTQSATVGNKDTTPIVHETVFRASKIKGMKVKNDTNQNLGSIDDLVISLPHGKLKYVALSYGSTLGLGGKLFAVPLSAMTLSHAQNETFLLVHVSEDALKNAPGFDKDRWPNTADPNWAKDVDSYYQRTATRPATRQ